MDDTELTRVARALSDPTRLGIFRMILGGRDQCDCSPQDACCPDGVCVCDLEARLGMIQSKVSYHLRELKAAGLITEVRAGKWNYYSPSDTRLGDFARAVEHLARPTAPVSFTTPGPAQDARSVDA